MKFFARKTENSSFYSLSDRTDPRWKFDTALTWRIFLLILIPLFFWAITDGRYRYVSETAGGIQFLVKIDRLNIDKTCLIMEAKHITPGLRPNICIQ
ncbi:MAG: hypothetical protein CMF69_04500 [Magnetovibrio sp.]|nr:hypothetical protein [Magnetovibrio sp.]